MAAVSYFRALGFSLLVASMQSTASDAFSSSLPWTQSGDVWLVRTSGTWSRSGTYGYYRVIVFRKVGEHAPDEVKVEILQANGDQEPLRLLHVISLPIPGYAGNIGDVSFGEAQETAIEIVFEVDLKSEEDAVRRDTYLVDANGRFSLSASVVSPQSRGAQPPSNKSLERTRGE